MKNTYEHPIVTLSPLEVGDVIKTSGAPDRDYTGDWDTDLQ